jgi:tetratricopeptide (TPR) repeat protein
MRLLLTRLLITVAVVLTSGTGATAAAINGTSLLPPNSSAEITNRGNEAHLRQQWQTAIDLYTQALEKDPQYYIALFNLGLTHQRWAERLTADHAKNSHLILARSAFEQARTLRPTEPAVFAHLGIVAHHLHDFSQAREYFDDAIQATTDPQMKADFLYNQATTLTALEDYAEAKKAYQQCIAIKPDHFSAHFNLGTLALQLGELITADEHLAQAATLDPQRPEPEVNRAVVALTRGGNQLEKAESHLIRAVELARSQRDPNLARILWLRADFYNQVELPDRQTRLLMRYDLEELLSINPNYPGANGRLGAYFDALADLDRAISYLEAELALSDQGVEKPNPRVDEQAHHLLALIYSGPRRNPQKALYHATAFNRMRPGLSGDRLTERVQEIGSLDLP